MRLASVGDISGIAELRVIQQKEFWGNRYNDSCDLYKNTSNFLKYRLNNSIYFFIEVVDGVIVSTCGIQILDKMPICLGNVSEAILFNVYTRKEYRGQGIQSRLLEEAIRFTKSRNIQTLKVSANSKNVIKLFEKLGFDIDYLSMCLELGY